MAAQQRTKPAQTGNINTSTTKHPATMGQPQPIPERDVKQNAGVSASLALQAGQKAWELRQAAHGAGDANAREEILAKAINKEIEAESFGKAAKYTQSGTFQGLAAGAGLGVVPGVTLGKLTGALVGGTVSTVTGLLGGGIGSVYGAMNGPMWNLGQMASHGVESIVGEWLPDWAATSSQKKALEKMVMQTKDTQAPTKEELEQMKADAPDHMPETWAETTKQMTSYIPSMPSMPSMPSTKGIGAALGLGGVGSSMAGRQGKEQPQMQQGQVPTRGQALKQNSQQTGQTQKTTAVPGPKAASSPKEASRPREVPNSRKITDEPAAKASTSQSKQTSSSGRTPPRKIANKGPTPPQSNPKPPTTKTKPTESPQSKRKQQDENTHANGMATANPERRKPRKLTPKVKDSNTKDVSPAPRRTPRKLETRQFAA